jgi:hypothetical protein
MTSTPRRGAGGPSTYAGIKQHYNHFRETTLPERRVDESKRTSARLALDCDSTAGPTISCEGLKWLDHLRHTQPQPPHAGVVKGKTTLLRLPPEIVRHMFSYCSMRALTYDLQLTCRSLRALARSGVWWDRFVLNDLVEHDLPIVSTFVVLDNSSETLRMHRQRFWLRHLADGRWPRAPKLVDLSMCSPLPPHWTNRALTSNAATGASTLRLSHSDCCFLSSWMELAPNQVLGNVTSLDVSFASHHVDGAVLHQLVSVMCPHLVSLDISGCESIVDEAAVPALRLTQATLRDLICCSSKLAFRGDHWNPFSLPTLTKFVMTQSSLFDDDSLQTIARAFPLIEVLHLSSCPQLTDGGIVEYVAAFRRFHSDIVLTDVSVDDCIQVSDLALTVILCSCPHLTSFSIERSWCTGTFLVNGAIGSPQGLKTLSIVGCLGLLREVMRGVAFRNALQKWSHLLNQRSRTFLVTNKLGGMLTQKK